VEYLGGPRRSNHKRGCIKLMMCPACATTVSAEGPYKVRPPRPVEMPGSVINIYHITEMQINPSCNINVNVTLSQSLICQVPYKPTISPSSLPSNDIPLIH